MDKIIIIIDEYLFDVTSYADKHPGGKRILKKFHLKDSTEEFNKIKGHGDGYILGLSEELCIGSMYDEKNKKYFE